MERPGHALEGLAASNKKAKTIATSVVIGIHIFIVIALIVGLRQAAIEKEKAAISANVEQAKAVPKAPPPPPPDLIRPPPQTAFVPDFAVVAPPPKPAAPPAPPAPPPAHIAPTKLTPIARTRTLPPYPTISQRLGEQGTVTVRVVIGVDGKVKESTLVKSSGSDRLDAAAVEHVKNVWRWQPPTQEGKNVEATTLVSVVFNLKDAQ